MNQTLYLNIKQLSEIHKKNVYLSDIADVYCSDSHVASRCKAVKVKTVHSDEKKRYVGNVLDVVKLISDVDQTIQVVSVGESDYIIDYKPAKTPHYLWEWAKTIFVCLVCFSGAAFAIMTFNNDVNVNDVFKEVYGLVMGHEAEGFTILEAAYSAGLAIGIIVFFDHFAKIKLNTDPTPLEVEMRIYEDDISKTLIQNDGRKESGVDVT